MSVEQEQETVLSDEEYKTIISGACQAAGNEGQSREELQQVCDWAVDARLMYATLILVLDGKVGACVKNGEVGFVSLEDSDEEQEE